MRGGGGRVLGATNDGSDLLYDQHNRDSDRPREIARRQGGGGGRGLNLPERRSVLAGQQQNLHQQQPVMSQHSSRRRREDHDDTDSHSIRSSQPLLSQLHTTAHRPTSNGDSSRNTTSSDGSKSNGRRKNDDNNAQAGRRPASSGSRGDRSRQSKADTRMYEDDTINARLLQQSQPLLSQLPNVSTLASIAPPKRPTTTTGERQIIPSQRERLRGGSKILDNQEQRQGVMSRLLSHGNPKNTIPTTNRYHQPYPSSSLGSTRHPPSVLGGSTKAIRTSGVISSTLAHTLSTPSRAFRSMTSLAARTVSSAGLIAMSPFRGIGAITGREGFRTTIGARLTSAFAASKLSNSTSSSTTAGGISMFTRPTSGSSILASVSDRKSSAAAESLTVTTGSSILPLSSTVSNGYKDTSSASAIADTFPPTVEERGDEGACSVVGHQYASANVGVKTNDNDHDESKELAKTRSGLTLDIQSKTDEIIATRELIHKHEQLQQSKQDLIDISERARQEMKDERERLEALQKSIDAKLGMMQSSIDAFSYKSASVTHDHELTIRTLVNKSTNDLRQESSQATDAITTQLQERMKSQLPSDVRALIDVEARKYMVEVIDGIVDAAKSDFQVWVDGIRDSPIAAEHERELVVKEDAFRAKLREQEDAFRVKLREQEERYVKEINDIKKKDDPYSSREIDKLMKQKDENNEKLIKKAIAVKEEEFNLRITDILASKAREYEHTISDLEDSVRVLKQIIGTKDKEFDAKVKELEDEIEQVKEELKDVTKDKLRVIEQHEIKVELLEDEIQELKQQETKASSKKDDRKSELSECKKELDRQRRKHRSEINQLKNTLEMQKSKQERLQSHIQSLEKQISDMVNDYESRLLNAMYGDVDGV